MAPPPPPTKPDTPLLLHPPPRATSTTTTSSSSGNTSGGGGAISNHEPLPRLPLLPSRAAGATKVQKPRSSKPLKVQLLRRPRRTSAFIWLVAVLCFVFSLSIILAGAATLFVFLVIKPKYHSSSRQPQQHLPRQAALLERRPHTPGQLLQPQQQGGPAL